MSACTPQRSTKGAEPMQSLVCMFFTIPRRAWGGKLEYCRAVSPTQGAGSVRRGDRHRPRRLPASLIVVLQCLGVSLRHYSESNKTSMPSVFEQRCTAAHQSDTGASESRVDYPIENTMNDRCVVCGEPSEGKPLYKKLGSEDIQVDVLTALQELELVHNLTNARDCYICWDCDETLANEYSRFQEAKASTTQAVLKQHEQYEASKKKLTKKLKAAFKAAKTPQQLEQERLKDEQRYFASHCLLCAGGFDSSRGFVRFNLLKKVDENCTVGHMITLLELHAQVDLELQAKRYICCGCFNSTRRKYRGYQKDLVESTPTAPAKPGGSTSSGVGNAFSSRRPSYGGHSEKKIPTAEEHAAEIAKLLPPSLADTYKIVCHSRPSSPQTPSSPPKTRRRGAKKPTKNSVKSLGLSLSSDSSNDNSSTSTHTSRSSVYKRKASAREGVSKNGTVVPSHRSVSSAVQNVLDGSDELALPGSSSQSKLNPFHNLKSSLEAFKKAPVKTVGLKNSHPKTRKPSERPKKNMTPDHVTSDLTVPGRGIRTFVPSQLKQPQGNDRNTEGSSSSSDDSSDSDSSSNGGSSSDSSSSTSSSDDSSDDSDEMGDEISSEMTIGMKNAMKEQKKTARRLKHLPTSNGHSTAQICNEEDQSVSVECVAEGWCNVCGLCFKARSKDWWQDLNCCVPNLPHVTFKVALHTLNTKLAEIPEKYKADMLVCKICSHRVTAGFKSQILEKVAASRGVSVTDIDVSKFKVRVMDDDPGSNISESKHRSPSKSSIPNSKDSSKCGQNSSNCRKSNSAAGRDINNFHESRVRNQSKTLEDSKPSDGSFKSAVVHHSFEPSFSSRCKSNQDHPPASNTKKQCHYLNRPSPVENGTRVNRGRRGKGHIKAASVASHRRPPSPPSFQKQGCRSRKRRSRKDDCDSDEDYQPTQSKKLIKVIQKMQEIQRPKMNCDGNDLISSAPYQTSVPMKDDSYYRKKFNADRTVKVLLRNLAGGVAAECLRGARVSAKCPSALASICCSLCSLPVPRHQLEAPGTDAGKSLSGSGNVEACKAKHGVTSTQSSESENGANVSESCRPENGTNSAQICKPEDSSGTTKSSKSSSGTETIIQTDESLQDIKSSRKTDVPVTGAVHCKPKELGDGVLAKTGLSNEAEVNTYFKKCCDSNESENIMTASGISDVLKSDISEPAPSQQDSKCDSKLPLKPNDASETNSEQLHLSNSITQAPTIDNESEATLRGKPKSVELLVTKVNGGLLQKKPSLNSLQESSKLSAELTPSFNEGPSQVQHNSAPLDEGGSLSEKNSSSIPAATCSGAENSAGASAVDELPVMDTNSPAATCNVAGGAGGVVSIPSTMTADNEDGVVQLETSSERTTSAVQVSEDVRSISSESRENDPAGSIGAVALGSVIPLCSDDQLLKSENVSSTSTPEGASEVSGSSRYILPSSLCPLVGAQRVNADSNSLFHYSSATRAITSYVDEAQEESGGGTLRAGDGVPKSNASSSGNPEEMKSELSEVSDIGDLNENSSIAPYANRALHKSASSTAISTPDAELKSSASRMPTSGYETLELQKLSNPMGTATAETPSMAKSSSGSDPLAPPDSSSTNSTTPVNAQMQTSSKSKNFDQNLTDIDNQSPTLSVESASTSVEMASTKPVECSASAAETSLTKSVVEAAVPQSKTLPYPVGATSEVMGSQSLKTLVEDHVEDMTDSCVLSPPNLMISYKWARISLGLPASINSGLMCSKCKEELLSKFRNFIRLKVSESMGVHCSEVDLRGYLITFNVETMNIVADPIDEDDLESESDAKSDKNSQENNVEKSQVMETKCKPMPKSAKSNYERRKQASNISKLTDDAVTVQPVDHKLHDTKPNACNEQSLLQDDSIHQKENFEQCCSKPISKHGNSLQKKGVLRENIQTQPKSSNLERKENAERLTEETELGDSILNNSCTKGLLAGDAGVIAQVRQAEERAVSQGPELFHKDVASDAPSRNAAQGTHRDPAVDGLEDEQGFISDVEIVGSEPFNPKRKMSSPTSSCKRQKLPSEFPSFSSDSEKVVLDAINSVYHLWQQISLDELVSLDLGPMKASNGTNGISMGHNNRSSFPSGLSKCTEDKSRPSLGVDQLNCGLVMLLDNYREHMSQDHDVLAEWLYRLTGREVDVPELVKLLDHLHQDEDVTTDVVLQPLPLQVWKHDDRDGEFDESNGEMEDSNPQDDLQPSEHNAAGVQSSLSDEEVAFLIRDELLVSSMSDHQLSLGSSDWDLAAIDFEQPFSWTRYLECIDVDALIQGKDHPPVAKEQFSNGLLHAVWRTCLMLGLPESEVGVWLMKLSPVPLTSNVLSKLLSVADPMYQHILAIPQHLDQLSVPILHHSPGHEGSGSGASESTHEESDNNQSNAPFLRASCDRPSSFKAASSSTASESQGQDFSEMKSRSESNNSTLAVTPSQRTGGAGSGSGDNDPIAARTKVKKSTANVPEPSALRFSKDVIYVREEDDEVFWGNSSSIAADDSVTLLQTEPMKESSKSRSYKMLGPASKRRRDNADSSELRAEKLRKLDYSEMSENSFGQLKSLALNKSLPITANLPDEPSVTVPRVCGDGNSTSIDQSLEGVLHETVDYATFSDDDSRAGEQEPSHENASSSFMPVGIEGLSDSVSVAGARVRESGLPVRPPISDSSKQRNSSTDVERLRLFSSMPRNFVPNENVSSIISSSSMTPSSTYTSNLCPSEEISSASAYLEHGLNVFCEVDRESALPKRSYSMGISSQQILPSVEGIPPCKNDAITSCYELMAQRPSQSLSDHESASPVIQVASSSLFPQHILRHVPSDYQLQMAKARSKSMSEDLLKINSSSTDHPKYANFHDWTEVDPKLFRSFVSLPSSAITSCDSVSPSKSPLTSSDEAGINSLKNNTPSSQASTHHLSQSLPKSKSLPCDYSSEYHSNHSDGSITKSFQKVHNCDTSNTLAHFSSAPPAFKSHSAVAEKRTERIRSKSCLSTSYFSKTLLSADKSEAGPVLRDSASKLSKSPVSVCSVSSAKRAASSDVNQLCSKVVLPKCRITTRKDLMSPQPLTSVIESSSQKRNTQSAICGDDLTSVSHHDHHDSRKVVSPATADKGTSTSQTSVLVPRRGANTEALPMVPFKGVKAAEVVNMFGVPTFVLDDVNPELSHEVSKFKKSQTVLYNGKRYRAYTACKTDTLPITSKRNESNRQNQIVTSVNVTQVSSQCNLGGEGPACDVRANVSTSVATKVPSVRNSCSKVHIEHTSRPATNQVKTVMSPSAPETKALRLFRRSARDSLFPSSSDPVPNTPSTTTNIQQTSISFERRFPEQIIRPSCTNIVGRQPASCTSSLQTLPFNTISGQMFARSFVANGPEQRQFIQSPFALNHQALVPGAEATGQLFNVSQTFSRSAFSSSANTCLAMLPSCGANSVHIVQSENNVQHLVIQGGSAGSMIASSSLSATAHQDAQQPLNEKVSVLEKQLIEIQAQNKLLMKMNEKLLSCGSMKKKKKRRKSRASSSKDSETSDDSDSTFSESTSSSDDHSRKKSVKKSNTSKRRSISKSNKMQRHSDSREKLRYSTSDDDTAKPAAGSGREQPRKVVTRLK